MTQHFLCRYIEVFRSSMMDAQKSQMMGGARGGPAGGGYGGGMMRGGGGRPGPYDRMGGGGGGRGDSSRPKPIIKNANLVSFSINLFKAVFVYACLFHVVLHFVSAYVSTSISLHCYIPLHKVMQKIPV